MVVGGLKHSVKWIECRCLKWYVGVVFVIRCLYKRSEFVSLICQPDIRGHKAPHHLAVSLTLVREQSAL